MVVVCDQCKKRYKVAPEKMKGRTAKFKCRECGNIITVTKPQEKTADPLRSEHRTPSRQETDRKSDPRSAGFDSVSMDTPIPSVKGTSIPDDTDMDNPPKPRKKPKLQLKGMGLTSQFLLFVLIPFIAIYAVSAHFSRENILAITPYVTEDFQKIDRHIRDLVKMLAAEKAKDVAVQVKDFLEDHPYLDRTQFNALGSFRSIAVQKIGSAGGTFLYEKPGPDGLWRVWAHEDAGMVGKDMSGLAKKIGEYFKGFQTIVTAVRRDGESEGYYQWKDGGRALREKYMACRSVEGTRYVVACTVDVDEWVDPGRSFGRSAEAKIDETINMNFVLMSVGLIVVMVNIFVFTRYVTKRIRSLALTADQISLGEIDIEIKDKSSDEIGELAESISRLQDSVKLAMVRLRKK